MAMSLPFRNISQRLMLVFFIVLLLASGSLGLTALYQSTLAVNEQVEQALSNIAVGASDTVRSRINTQLATLSELAEQPLLQALSDDSLSYLGEATQRLGYLGLGWVNAAGIAHYPGGNTADLGNRSYIIKAFENQTNMSDVIISRVINKPVIMLATPIQDKATKKVKAVLIARMDASLLSTITDDLGFGKSGFAFVINEKGILIAGRDRERILNQHNMLENGSPENIATFKTLLDQRKGTVNLNVDADQQDYLIGFAPIENTGWVLGVTAKNSEVFERLNLLQWLLSLMSIAALIIGMALAWVFSQSIVIKPLQHIKDVVQKIQQTGNLQLRATVTGQDEVAITGQALNAMMDSFQGLVSKISGSTEELFAASEQLDQNSQMLLSESSHQASITTQLVAALEEMNSAIHEVAQNTVWASERAETAVQQTNAGRDQVSASQKTIDQLEQEVVATANIVSELNSRTQEIDQVLSIISSIAEQTNLLALNAAIEAARAGEHGRGFAVVADEVRSLAGNSQQAAGSIREKIESFRHAAQQALKKMQQCSTFAAEGTESSRESTRRFNQTADSTHEILELNQQIASATEEQSAVISELNLTLNQLNDGIRDVTNHARDTASASALLTNLAQTLKTETNQFNI
ncbi:MAG TPA: methyl-accepting chemotaxis protein [Marinospirillum sp.]|uniref:methyl-accepting chemotaxis protein n=1 Tax=Marinospirillum sp. TaxID=2183934 RepID=UPI002B48ED7F|nr:methyl-accepting chemotaxis protein [Marinospirillum sp.]HKM14776.1 methyl-accepting chemotaxis protein [Marinospirillum sp.]